VKEVCVPAALLASQAGKPDRFCFTESTDVYENAYFYA
jgi:hypothetical protein